MTRLSSDNIYELEQILGADSVSTGPSEIDLHSKDESFQPPSRPEVVVWPTSVDHVSKVLGWANAHEIPVTAWGAGTSLEGNPIPLKGGVVMDFQRMNRILSLYREDFMVDVEAGVSYRDLNEHLRHTGLFFPPDPGASATIGGMIANNASGIRTVKYGSTRDYVMRMVLVLADGRVVKTGTRSRKTSSGYDLRHLFIGSEGTLGLVCEATLKLVGIPNDSMAVMAAFQTSKDAANAVSQIIMSGLEPSAMEFLDARIIGLLNNDRDLGLDETPHLLMEFHGSNIDYLSEVMSQVQEICKENGCLNMDQGLGTQEKNRVWDIRYHALESIKRSAPGLSPYLVDVAVPISQFSRMVQFTKEALRDFNAYILGHAGDGNVHVAILEDPNNKERWNRISDACRQVVLMGLKFGGTSTGEHGVGIGKKQYMAEEHGESLQVMKLMKQTLDPRGILNPDKIFP